jgi:type I restriction enzyme S subunit
MATSQDFVTWTCSAAIEPRYVMSALMAEGDDIRRFGKGTIHTTIYFPEVKAFQVALPPVEEQCRIVAKIETLSARSKRVRADLNRVDALAARAMRAVATAAFSGNLTRDWRLDHPNEIVADDALVLSEQRRAIWDERQAELGRARKLALPEKHDWAPDLELPGGWRWVSVDQVAPIIEYGSSAKTSPTGQVPVLRMGNIQDGRIVGGDLKYLPHDHEEFPALLLCDGDLLFNRTNSPELVGKTAVYRGEPKGASFASYLIRLRTAGYAPELLALYINSSFGRAWVKSVVTQQVGQANVNGTKLSRLAVPLMSKPEQREILQRVTAAFRSIDVSAAEVRRATALLNRLDQSILAKAFRGELVPQDPHDEPVSALLDRIHSERGIASTPKRRRGKPQAEA